MDMSYVVAAPGMLAAAAADVAAVGSTVSAAHLAAAAPTVALTPAAADEVSAGIAQLFSRCAQEYHALAGQAAAFSEQFVQHLNAGARAYAGTEAASAASLQPVTASAASNVSAAAALPGQFLDTLIGSWNTLINDLSVYVQTLYNVAYLSALVAYEAAILSYLLLNFAILNVRGLLSQMFGITIPLSLPSL
jgi:hypothetical protein